MGASCGPAFRYRCARKLIKNAIIRSPDPITIHTSVDNPKNITPPPRSAKNHQPPKTPFGFAQGRHRFRNHAKRVLRGCELYDPNRDQLRAAPLWSSWPTPVDFV